MGDSADSSGHSVGSRARGRSPHRGVVSALPAGAKRPLWSVMIPAYNCARDLERCLVLVVAQTAQRQDMQIEVVDDCSTMDDPEDVVRAVGAGRVTFYRQPRNVGHSRNFNTCLARSRGELIHLLHADDWVGDGFYHSMTELFAAHPSIGAAFCRHAVVEPHGTAQWISPVERESPGIVDDWLEKIAGEQRVQAPAVVVRRGVYEALGGFDTRIATCGEDWEMWVRIAVAYPVGFLPDLLAFYQDNPASLTKRAIRSGQNIRDLRAATEIVRGYLPEALARRSGRRARESWAEFALRWANLAARQGNARSTLVQLREALTCSRSRATLRSAARVGRTALGTRLRGLAMPSETKASKTGTGLIRFVIVGTGRTGSTMLISLINNHSEALTFGELFRSPDSIGWDVPSHAPASDAAMLAVYRHHPVRFLQSMVFRDWKPGQRAMGFKIFYYHAREFPFAAVWEYLRNETDIRVLHVKRRNVLAQYLSLQRAHMTDRWSGPSQDAISAPLHLSPEECQRHFAWVRRSEAEHDAFFARHPVLPVIYEDLLTGQTGQMARVQDFLGLNRERLAATTVRQSSRPLSEAIANYEELEVSFAGTEWAEFFSGASDEGRAEPEASFRLK
jgi:LPS sulfotransferase NodH/glycosyltransferase involved in cell wall biosynthesis